MMTRPCIRRCCAVLAVTAALASAGCGSSPASPGPLQEASSDGEPDVAGAFVLVDQGQAADGEVYVVNSAHSPVLVTAISEIPVPGYRSATLHHTAITKTGAGVATARGWPPPVPVRPAIGGTLPVPVRPAIGGTLPPGLSQIVFGFSGPRAGQDYAMAGVTITYEYHGQTYSAPAWTAEAACTTPESLAACQAYLAKVNALVEKMAGLS
jgi:hypothetical protein